MAVSSCKRCGNGFLDSVRGLAVNADERSRAAPRPPAAAESAMWYVVDSPADGCEADPLTSVRSKPLKTNGGTVADDADANFPPQSALEKTGWRARL
jgi:hypothetical protein